MHRHPFSFVTKFCAIFVTALASVLSTCYSNVNAADASSKDFILQILPREPRPKRSDVPPSKLPIEFLKGERIAFLGNSLAERMNLFGHFETGLHTRFPDKELVVRNFARPAEEVGVQQRSADYTAIDDPLLAFGADTYICFFGSNESYAGPDGIDAFRQKYEQYLDAIAKGYPRDDVGSAPRFILVSPIAFESTADRLLPDGVRENEYLKLYSDAVAAVATKRNLAFVNIFDASQILFSEKPGMQWTINGCHLSDAGDGEIARMIDHEVFRSASPASFGSPHYELLRSWVNDKSWVHLQDYRMLNGWYVYGGRRTWDTETFPREYAKIRKMAAVRDRGIWDLAQGKKVNETPDDSATGDLFEPQTRFGEPRQKYSEADTLRYLPPAELIAATTLPKGFELRLFADESRFPDIAKPVQLNFDNRGRLWLACMPTYPQWKPGDSRPNDKLVILTDSDGDGVCDSSTVFYDKLHCPTGFEFFNGGVLVVDQPRLLF